MVERDGVFKKLQVKTKPIGEAKSVYLAKNMNFNKDRKDWEYYEEKDPVIKERFMKILQERYENKMKWSEIRIQNELEFNKFLLKVEMYNDMCR